MENISELVFNGGGAKGAGMPGVYFALSMCNKWDNIDAIAGTSVGSLSAALFSVSPNLSKFAEFIDKTNFNNELNISYTFFPLYMRQDRLKTFVNDFLKKEIMNFLKSNESSDIKDLKDNVNSPDYKITFHDMQVLNNHDPKKFKQLTFVSVKTNPPEKIIHNATNSPKMAICDACAASCSLPYVFEKCIVDNEHHLDGGLRDPLPSECFNDNSEAKQKARLIFVFGSGPFSSSNLWKHALENSPKVNFECVEDFDTKTEVNNILIQYKLDNAKKQLLYKKSGLNQVFSIDYADLDLDENATKDNMHGKLLDFCKILKKRNHIPYLFGYYNPIWILDFIAPLINYIIGFPVLIISLFEDIAQRLQTYYQKNTVCLDSGSIEPIYFYKAEKFKSTLCAIYFLDTLLHLNEEAICRQVYTKYQTCLDNQEPEYSKEELLRIKQYASKWPYSRKAQALTEAYQETIKLQSGASFDNIPSNQSSNK